MAAQVDTNPPPTAVVASQTDTKQLTPVPYRERESTYISNNSLSEDSHQAKPGQVQLNGVAIYGPGFALEYAAIDLAAGMIGMSKERARAIAEICARDWASNNKKPVSPMAMVKRAMTNDFNETQTQSVRMEKAGAKDQSAETTRQKIARFAEEAEERMRAKKGARP
jgi:hypothetical protein